MKPVILMYHRVADLGRAERYTVSPSEFARQMRYLHERNYNVMTLSVLLECFAGRASIPDQPVIITFDDGFMDSYEHTCPVLHDLGFHATFFIITGLIGKTNTWMSSRGEPSTALMGWREIENLQHHGFEVGSHAVTHRDLTEMSLEQAKQELSGSKRALEDRLGVPITFLAYPYGRSNGPLRDLARAAGYAAACATAPGFIDLADDHFELKRIEVAGTDSMRTFAEKLKFGAKRRSCADLARYYARRAVAKTFGR